MHQNDENTVKVSFKCPASYKAEFKNSHCLLVISVGQKAHEGEIFQKTIQLINNSFRECTILVADTLQRHTLAIENIVTDEILYQQSMNEGNEWMERNKKIYNELTIPYEIMRWDHWLKRAEYTHQLNLVTNLYKTDKKVMASFHITINNFIARYQVRTRNSFDLHKAFQHCLNYLQEECAVMCLRAKEIYDFEIYPSGRTEAMVMAYTHLVEPCNPRSLISVSLNIRTKKPKVYLTSKIGTHNHEQI